MPKFIQSLDLNGNKIYNIPAVEAGKSQNLLIKAPGSISLESAASSITAETSINITSGNSSSLILEGGMATLEGNSSTTVGKNSSNTNINASILKESSETSHSIITPALNINNGNNEGVKTKLVSIANISNEGSLKNTGKVEVAGDEDLIGGNLTVKGSSTDNKGTVISSGSVTFNKVEEILNKETLTLAKNKREDVYDVGDIKSYENIVNEGTINNTGNVTIKNSTLKIEEGSQSISITKNSIDSDTGVTLFNNQTVNAAGTEYTYEDVTTVNFEGNTNLKGPTEASANVTITNANLSVTGATTLTGSTTAKGGKIDLGDDSYPTTIKGSALSISSSESLEFSPSIKVSDPADKGNFLLINPGALAGEISSNKKDLLITAPNATITSAGTSTITGASVKIIDSTPSENGLISSGGNTTLSGDNSVVISSSESSVSITSKTEMNLEGKGDVSIKSTGVSSTLNLGRPGNVTNINGSNITLTHDNGNSVDVISELTVKDSAGGPSVKITSGLIEGNNSKGLSVKSSSVKIQGDESTSIKSPEVTVGPVTGDTQVTIDTRSESLTVKNSAVGITTEEVTSIKAQQINLTSTGDGDAGKTVVVGGLDVTGGITTDNLEAKSQVKASTGNFTESLETPKGEIGTLTSTQADFVDHIKIGNIILRYDNTSKALLFEVGSQETQGGEENSNS